MSNNSLISKEKFWQFLMELEAVEHNEKKEWEFDSFLERLELNEGEFVSYLSFLRNLDFKISLRKVNGINMVEFIGSKTPVKFEFSFAEWLSFQAHFPKLSELSHEPYHQILASKLLEIEAKYPQFDLHNIGASQEMNLYPVKNSENEEQLDKEVINVLEKCLAHKSVIELKLNDKEGFSFFPHRLVYLDGGLTLVGEDCTDKCLVYFYVKNISAINLDIDHKYDTNFSLFEVDEFINAVRSVAGKEIRLVLKITSEEMIDLNPKYQFLGNPYITANPEGEMIWAASVEKSELLFEWLMSIKDSVEILDPSWLSEEFVQYMDNVIPFKKAS